MADLKLDLLNKIRNDKYYAEIELVRLAQDPNTVYKDKINAMQSSLQEISILNAEMGLVEQYFKAPEQQQVAIGQPVNQPAGVVHQGQSHGE
jgi:hypothetical protein